MYIDENGETRSGKAEVEMIKTLLEGLSEVPEVEDAKFYVLESMAMTGSFVKKEDVLKLLPQDKKDLANEILKDRLGESCSIERHYDKEKFYFGSAFITALREQPDLLQIDLNEVNLEDLVSISIDAMKRHRQASSFYRMGEVDGELVPDLLDSAISSLEKYQEKSKQDNAEISKDEEKQVQEESQDNEKTSEVNLEDMTIEELEKYEDGLDEEIIGLQKQLEEKKRKDEFIKRINEKIEKSKILKKEINILENGTKNLPDDVIQ